LDKVLYDDYLCLVALKKLSGKKSKKQPQNLEMDNSQTGTDSAIIAFS